MREFNLRLARLVSRLIEEQATITITTASPDPHCSRMVGSIIYQADDYVVLKSAYAESCAYIPYDKIICIEEAL